MSNGEPIETPGSNIPPSRNNLWLVWIVIGLAPIPIGLLMGPMNIFNSYGNKDKGPFVLYAVIAAICSLICGIGQCGGFRSRRIGDISRGIVFGMFMVMVNLFVVFFAGCCSAFKRI